MPAPKSAATTTPVSTRVRIGSWPRTQVPTPITSVTATIPPAKASPWIANTGSESRIAPTAPSAHPADTPRMSGETSGLRNRFW